MVAVSPTLEDIRLAHRPALKSARFYSTALRWIRRVVGRAPGEYTIGKLDAFHHFQSTTSTPEALVTLLLTPIPCFIATFAVESIPLGDPASGFNNSLNFQVRYFVADTIMTMGPVMVKLACVPQAARTWKFGLVYSLAVSFTGVATTAAIAITVGVFPVPLTQFTPAIPKSVVGILLNRRFLSRPESKNRFAQIDRLAVMDALPVFIYPIFTAVFMALEPIQQLWFSLVLPVIKLLLRHAIFSLLRDELDIVGPASCSIGHLYHIFFTAVCLQNAKALEMLVAYVVVNTIQMLLNCRTLLTCSNNIRTDVCGQNMIYDTLELARDNEVSSGLDCKSPSRLYSRYPKYQRQGANLSPVQPRATAQTKCGPFDDRVVTAESTQCAGKVETQIHSITSALHQTEIILLRSYITIFMLAFYGIYLQFVFRLPNHKYFVTMRVLTTTDAVDRAIGHLFLLGSIEVMFVVVYLALIWRHFRVSGLRQLAFILWSQRILLQAKFVVLPLMILGFPLEHFGNGIIYKLHPSE